MTSNPTPNVYAADLQLMVESDLPWSAIQRYALLLEKQGFWNRDTPIDERNNPLVVSFMAHLGRKRFHDNPLGEDEWKQVFGLAPENVWEFKTSGYGETLATLVAKTFQEEETRNSYWDPEVWKRLPVAALKDWVPSYRDPRRSEQNILSMLLSSDRIELAKILFSRGWTWKDNVARSIVSEKGWRFFLETGGNPYQELKRGEPGDNHYAQSIPLWRYLLESGHSNAELKEALREWAKANVSAELSQKDITDYWNRLDRVTGSAEVQKAVRSRPDWPTLRNADGESPLLVAAHQHMSAVETIGKTAKALPALTAVDKFGWNLWHHLLSEGQKVTGAALAIAKEHVPPRAQADKGLLVKLYTRKRKGVSQMNILRSRNLFGPNGKLPASKPGVPTVEDWWAGSPADLETLARAWMGDEQYIGSTSIQNSALFSSSEACDVLAELVRQFPPPSDAPPLLKGAIALNELVTSSRRGGAERYGLCEQLVAEGAVLDMSPKFQGEIEKALGKMGDEARALYKQLVLNGRLEPAAPRSRPRM